VAFASSLDQVGPLGRDVADCAALLSCIAGYDPKDSTSADQAVPEFRTTLEDGVKGLRIGLPREYFVDGLHPEVALAVDAAIDSYRRLGAEIVDVSLPHTEYGIAAYYLLCTAEASSNLARFDGVRYGKRVEPSVGKGGLVEMYRATRGKGFGLEVKRRIMLGTYALSAGYYDAYYAKAQKVRTLLKEDFARAFEKADVLLTPTTPAPAFRLGENAADPVQMYLGDVFTVGCNLAGLPGMSLPCGFSKEGLPLGVQLLGPAWSEAQLFRVGRAYEREHDWTRRRPPV
jgi:aspartyl-tRNA(Asn)/glutamyl-tRNA(Gln) amidotransferase subunit A